MTPDFGPDDAAPGGEAILPEYLSGSDEVFFFAIINYGDTPFEGRSGMDRNGMEQWLRYNFLKRHTPQKFNMWVNPFSSVIQVLSTPALWLESLADIRNTSRIYGNNMHTRITVLEYWSPGARIV